METLTAEVSKREPELRAALAAEVPTNEVLTPTVDAEQSERTELRGKAKVGAFVSAALNSQAVTGAEAEYAASVGCGTLNMIPISIFDRDRLEVRAVTPGVDAQNTANPTAPYVFERSHRGQRVRDSISDGSRRRRKLSGDLDRSTQRGGGEGHRSLGNSRSGAPRHPISETGCRTISNPR